MAAQVDALYTDSSQFLNCQRKKKKKKHKLEEHDEVTNEQPVSPSLHPASSDHSSILSWHIDTQDPEDLGSQKKKKKKKCKLKELNEETNEQPVNPPFYPSSDQSSILSWNIDTQDPEELGSQKKKKKKKSRTEELNAETNEQPVNPFLSPSSNHSSILSWNIDTQDPEDVDSQKKKKKKKKKRRTEELNEETNEQPVNPFLSPSFSTDHSFPSWHLNTQDTEDYQAEQHKSKRKKKDTGETSASQLENGWLAAESSVESEVGAGAIINKKRKRKHNSSEQDGDSTFFVPETQEEASSLPEPDHLEDVGGSYEITSKKKKKKKKAKASSGEQVEAREASLGRTGFAGDLGNAQTDVFVSPSQDADFLQSEIEIRLSVSDPSAEFSSPIAQKKSRKHKKHCNLSSPAVNSDATEDGLSVEDTVEAGGKHGKSGQHHELQKSPLRVHTKEAGLSSPTHPTSEPVLLDNEFLESLDVPSQDLETVTQELEEFIPHVRKYSESFIKQLARRDLIRFKNFKKQGIPVKFGKFSKKENEMLKKNVEAFLKESGIESAEKLLFTYRFPEEQASLKKLKCDRLFGLKIAQGIPRPWRLVYYRARKMFDPQNYNGRYSKKEKKKLRKYQAMHGNNWKKISELMGRSSHSLQLKYHEMTSEFNSGAWSREETKKLVEVVKEILIGKVEGLDPTQEPKNMDQALLLREKLYTGIPWAQVEAKVRTRGWKQCKKKWLSIVTKKMSQGKMRNRGLENLRFKTDIIERLYRLNVEDADDIDWEDLSRVIGNVPPDYTRSRFYRITSMYVPSWNQRNFSETIDYLYKEILPKLKSKIAGRERKKKVEDWKSVFQFQDIFKDDDDDDDDKDDGLIEEEEEEEKEWSH